MSESIEQLINQFYEETVLQTPILERIVLAGIHSAYRYATACAYHLPVRFHEAWIYAYRHPEALEGFAAYTRAKPNAPHSESIQAMLGYLDYFGVSAPHDCQFNSVFVGYLLMHQYDTYRHLYPHLIPDWFNQVIPLPSERDCLNYQIATLSEALECSIPNRDVLQAELGRRIQLREVL